MDQARLINNTQPLIIGWALESHAIAQSVAYPDVPSRPNGGWSVAYQAQTWPVVQTQLQRAGVRLAEVLSESLRCHGHSSEASPARSAIPAITAIRHP